nr:MAG TPA: hypothetical protein [Caudoviricetes sp.]
MLAISFLVNSAFPFILADNVVSDIFNAFDNVIPVSLFASIFILNAVLFIITPLFFFVTF